MISAFKELTSKIEDQDKVSAFVDSFELCKSLSSKVASNVKTLQNKIAKNKGNVYVKLDEFKNLYDAYEDDIFYKTSDLRYILRSMPLDDSSDKIKPKVEEFVSKFTSLKNQKYDAFSRDVFNTKRIVKSIEQQVLNNQHSIKSEISLAELEINESYELLKSEISRIGLNAGSLLKEIKRMKNFALSKIDSCKDSLSFLLSELDVMTCKVSEYISKVSRLDLDFSSNICDIKYEFYDIEPVLRKNLTSEDNEEIIESLKSSFN